MMWSSIVNSALNWFCGYRIDTPRCDDMNSNPLIDGGFHRVMDYHRGRYVRGFDPDREYEFMRSDWDIPCRFRIADQEPWFNIAGLYYREKTITLPLSEVEWLCDLVADAWNFSGSEAERFEGVKREVDQVKLPLARDL